MHEYKVVGIVYVGYSIDVKNWDQSECTMDFLYTVQAADSNFAEKLVIDMLAHHPYVSNLLSDDNFRINITAEAS